MPDQLEMAGVQNEAFRPLAETAIDRLLCQHEQFLTDSILYTKVASRLDTLCDGEDFERPELIVVHDSKPEEFTAFATPGYVVLGDNILGILEYEEELDALLAHELTHIERQHIEKGQAQHGRLEQIGHVRTSEFEADMRPLELLDRKGINPMGMVSLFNRLEAVTIKPPGANADHKHRPQHKPKSPPLRIDDFEHGTLVDRRVNVEEMLRLFDVRNLSPTVSKKLSFIAADFVGYQRDSALLAQYDSLSTQDKRRLLTRQLKAQDPDTGDKYQELIRLTTELIAKTAHDLDPDDQLLAASIFIKSLCPSIKPQDLPSCGLNPEPATDNPNTLNVISLPARITKILTDPGLIRNHVHPGGIPAADAIASMLQYNIDSRRVLPPAKDYIALIRLFDGQPTSPDLVTVLWEPALSYIYSRPGSPDAVTYCDEFARHTPSPLSLLDYRQRIAAMSSPNLLQTIIEDKIEPLDELLLTTRAERARIQQAVNEPADVVELLDLAFRFGMYSLARGYGPEESDLTEMDNLEYASYGSLSYGVGKKFDNGNAIVQALHQQLASITADELLESIYLQRQTGVLKDTSDRGFAWVLWYEIYRFDHDVPPKYKPGHEEPPDAYSLLENSSYEERLLLASLLLNKAGMINFANDQFLVKEIENSGTFQHSKHEILAAAQSFIAQVEAILKVHEACQALGFETNWIIQPVDLANAPLIQSAAFTLLSQLIQYENFHKAARIAALVPLSDLDHVKNEDAIVMWEKMVDKLLRVKTMGQTELSLLANLATIAPELSSRIELPPLIIQEIARQLPFEAAVDFVCDGLPTLPRYLFFSALDDLIEHTALSLADFDLLSRKLGGRLLAFIEDAAPSLGKISLADGILLPNYGQMESTERRVGVAHDQILGVEALRALTAMLSTARSDKDLQRYLMQRW